MKWKEFFKPTIGVIIIFIFLLIIFSLKHSSSIDYDGEQCSGEIKNYGFPLPIWNINYQTCIEDSSQTLFGVTYPLNLVIILIISYLISCLIVFVYNRFKK